LTFEKAHGRAFSLTGILNPRRLDRPRREVEEIEPMAAVELQQGTMAGAVTSLQEARQRLEELMPEIYRTLNNWSLEPSWQRAAGDWTAMLSEYLNREAAYRAMLEDTVTDLAERVCRLESRATG
jgi:hypothetical protein